MKKIQTAALAATLALSFGLAARATTPTPGQEATKTTDLGTRTVKQGRVVTTYHDYRKDTYRYEQTGTKAVPTTVPTQVWVADPSPSPATSSAPGGGLPSGSYPIYILTNASNLYRDFMGTLQLGSQKTTFSGPEIDLGMGAWRFRGYGSASGGANLYTITFTESGGIGSGTVVTTGGKSYAFTANFDPSLWTGHGRTYKGTLIVP